MIISKKTSVAHHLSRVRFLLMGLDGTHFILISVPATLRR